MEPGRRKRSGMKCFFFAVMCAFFLTSSPCWANLPFAGQHYPEGAEDFMSGALPPQGFYLKNYFGLFQKNKLADADGNRVPGDFHVDVEVIVPRFIWVTPLKVFGADVATQFFIPVYNSRIDAPGIGIDSQSTGIGDFIYTPIVLGWHFKSNLHLVLAEDIFLPSGDYDPSNYASQILNKNDATFESILDVTYLWKGLDASAKFMYDVNTKNHNYLLPSPGGGLSGTLNPGDEFHFDWAVGYSDKRGVTYGVSGYCYWQVTKDKFKNGATEVTGDKGRVFAAGPTIKYWPRKGPFSATLKYTWEFGARSLPQGQTGWLDIIYAF